LATEFSGPYYYNMLQFKGPQGLLPGDVINFWIGPFEPFSGTVTVTPHPGTLLPGPGTQKKRTAMWVRESAVEYVPLLSGPADRPEVYIWTTYYNSGSYPIREFKAWLCFNKP
jgi:hypothetical protein